MTLGKGKKKEPYLFYVFDEHENYDIEWLKKGGKIKNFGENKSEYYMDDSRYQVMNCHEIYSGWVTTMMKLPESSYEQLFEKLCHTNVEDELFGIMGIMLKKYYQRFISDFLGKDNIMTRHQRKRCCRILEFIYNETAEVQTMEHLRILSNK